MAETHASANDSTIHSITLSERRSQALLDTLGKQIVRAPVPMIVAAVVIAGIANQKAPVVAVLVWLSAAISMQFVRFVVIRRLVNDTTEPASQRLKSAGLLSLVHGLVLGSSIFFFPYLDETSRALYTMILVGIVCGTIATSHGYRPIFLGLTAPILFVLTIAWIFTDTQSLSFVQTFSIALLIVTLGLLLYISSKDVYRSFSESFLVRQQLETALESERSANAAKTRFLAAASHDLRQPLHTMSMLSAALTLRDLDDRSREIAERMNYAMSDLSKELDSLLDISKLDAGVMRVKPSEFEVNSSIRKLVQNYRDLATRKGLDLTHAGADSIYILADKALFERAVRNLLDNAIKYTHEGVVSISTRVDGGNCVITLSDTGIGIPSEEQEKVKEEFYQLTNPERDRQKGLGLGLSIVWRLIPLINGTLSMKSTSGVGTSYVMTLPSLTQLTDVSADTTDKSSEITRTSQFKDIVILLVEDDLEVRNGTRTLLENSGFTVAEASGTREAVTKARELPVRLALVDLRLPDGDSGFNTIESLRAITPSLPIIILSGETSPDVLQQSIEAGCEFLVKPVEVAELLREINTALSHQLEASA